MCLQLEMIGGSMCTLYVERIHYATCDRAGPYIDALHRGMNGSHRFGSFWLVPELWILYPSQRRISS